MRIGSLCFFLLIAVSSVGQSGQNPFDIVSRKDSTSQTIIHKEKYASQNAFDVVRPDTDIAVTTVPTPTTTTKIVVQDTVKAESPATAIQEPQDIEPQEIVSTGKNVFEVSHVPLRKSKLKQDADAFTRKVKKSQSKQDTSSNTFIFWLALLSGLLLAVVINTHRSVISKLVKSVTNGNVLRLNKRNENGGFSIHYLMLYLSFFINAGILVYLIVAKYWEHTSIKVFFYCLGGVFLIYISKHLSLKVLSEAFPIKKDVSLYNFSIESYNIFLGLVLLPINLVVAFGPTQLSSVFLYIAVIIVGIVILVRSYRGLVIASPYLSKHIFHFFLYLCAFEIVPLLFLVKLVV